VGGFLDTSASRDRALWIVLIGSFAMIMLINPAGFIGGGNDDWQYLNAARCLREHGFCLPQDHWQARWPVIVPIALFTEMLGESRLSVSIAPTLASFLSLVLLALIGNRLFHKPVGWIAALLLLLTPAFAVQLSEPSVEATELCLIFAGFLSVLFWHERPRFPLAFAAGLLFSLAIQVRETALVAAPFAFAYLCFARPRPKLSDLLLASAGFALPFLVEFAWFAFSTGDPFYRLKLSIHHTQIWSSELRGPIDRSHPPFFNKAYIANWNLQPGIHVHWAIDGLLNLVVNGVAGISIPFVALLLVFGHHKLESSVFRPALILWLTAITYAAILIYAFAVDPKPRMMLVPVTLTSLALALTTLRIRQAGYSLVAYSIWLAAAIVGMTLQFGHERAPMTENAARKWIAQNPGQIEIESSTRKYLALVPAAQSLPSLRADRPLLLLASGMSCAEWIKETDFPGVFTVVATARSTLVHLPHAGGELCLLRYDQRISGDRMQFIIRHVWLKERIEQRRGYVPTESIGQMGK
jgi:hypothetical protein